VKILLISPTFSGIGGIAQHVKGLNQYLKISGHEVNVLSSDNSFTIPVKGLKNLSFMISSSLKTKFMKKYDIVHAHNIPSAKAMKNAKGKKILSIHGIFSEQVDMLHGKTTGNLSKKYETGVLQWADAITVVSKEAKDHYSKLGFNVYHIPNAVDINKIPKKGRKLFQNQIIFVGRLSKEKGVIQLLKLVEILPKNITLLILGSGPLENLVKKTEQKFQNLKYLGFKSKEETLEFIKGSDLLIHPSLVEGISSTLLEAMVCKIPIIASDIPGNRELITNNENGILIDPNNVDLISQNIQELLSNKEKCSNFIQKSSNVITNYSWEKVGKLYLELYHSLLN